jgi:DNA-binding LytR/AlgR family response regulator
LPVKKKRVQTAMAPEFVPRPPRTGPSTTLRTLVVEDDWVARNYLIELIQSSSQAEMVSAVATADEARKAVRGEGADGVSIDVAFVNVALEGGASGESGLTLVRSLAAHPGAPMFVLATAYEKHALEAPCSTGFTVSIVPRPEVGGRAKEPAHLPHV